MNHTEFKATSYPRLDPTLASILQYASIASSKHRGTSVSCRMRCKLLDNLILQKPEELQVVPFWTTEISPTEHGAPQEDRRSRESLGRPQTPTTSPSGLPAARALIITSRLTSKKRRICKISCFKHHRHGSHKPGVVLLILRPTIANAMSEDLQ